MRLAKVVGAVGHSLVGVCLALGLARPAAGQAAQTVFQVEAGLGYGTGGSQYRARGAFAADLMLARISAAPNRRAFALFGGVQGAPGVSDICEPGPRGTCLDEFPMFYSLGASVGMAWDTHGGALSFSVHGGPSVHRAEEGGTAFGVSARSQATIRIWGPLAATVAVKGSVLPNYRGDALGLSAFGVGLALRP